MINLEAFEEELQLQNLAESTIQEYLYQLKKLPSDFTQMKKYILKNRTNRMLIVAYRKYLNFMRKQGQISGEELLAQLDTFRPPKKRGTPENGNWFPRKQWEELIAKAPNRCAKMGIWIGLQFGLRVGEIIHLRVQDIDSTTHNVQVRSRPGWHPKHYRDRSIPMTPTQEEILSRWITERPKLEHLYLIYNSRLKQVTNRTFQRWCKAAHSDLKPHDLRRSFAKVLYYESKKDLKLVQLTLGHSNIGTTSHYLNIEAEEIHQRYVEAMS